LHSVFKLIQGTATPLLGIGLCVSIQFSVFHQCRRSLIASNRAKGSLTDDLSYGQYYVAGAAAGVANSVVAGPVEHVRIRLQTQPSGANRLYSGPLDCIQKMSKQEGLFRGIYRGQITTILREAQGYGLWFLTYEYLMRKTIQNGTSRDQIPTWRLAVYGATAGYVLWLGSYPLDVIKSRLQSDFRADGLRKYHGGWDCVKKTWMEGGMRAFWKGIVPTMLRAAPASGGTFAAYG
jgi:solute carrier family 25 carnitine/acylcarnitine transporter 20/29